MKRTTYIKQYTKRKPYTGGKTKFTLSETGSTPEPHTVAGLHTWLQDQATDVDNHVLNLYQCAFNFTTVDVSTGSPLSGVRIMVRDVDSCRLPIINHVTDSNGQLHITVVAREEEMLVRARCAHDGLFYKTHEAVIRLTGDDISMTLAMVRDDVLTGPQDGDIVHDPATFTTRTYFNGAWRVADTH